MNFLILLNPSFFQTQPTRNTNTTMTTHFYFFIGHATSCVLHEFFVLMACLHPTQTWWLLLCLHFLDVRNANYVQGKFHKNLPIFSSRITNPTLITAGGSFGFNSVQIIDLYGHLCGRISEYRVEPHKKLKKSLILCRQTCKWASMRVKRIMRLHNQ